MILFAKMKKFIVLAISDRAVLELPKPECYGKSYYY